MSTQGIVSKSAPLYRQVKNEDDAGWNPWNPTLNSFHHATEAIKTCKWLERGSIAVTGGTSLTTNVIHCQLGGFAMRSGGTAVGDGSKEAQMEVSYFTGVTPTASLVYNESELLLWDSATSTNSTLSRVTAIGLQIEYIGAADKAQGSWSCRVGINPDAHNTYTEVDTFAEMTAAQTLMRRDADCISFSTSELLKGPKRFTSVPFNKTAASIFRMPGNNAGYIYDNSTVDVRASGWCPISMVGTGLDITGAASFLFTYHLKLEAIPDSGNWVRAFRTLGAIKSHDFKGAVAKKVENQGQVEESFGSVVKKGIIGLANAANVANELMSYVPQVAEPRYGGARTSGLGSRFNRTPLALADQYPMVIPMGGVVGRRLKSSGTTQPTKGQGRSRPTYRRVTKSSDK